MSDIRSFFKGAPSKQSGAPYAMTKLRNEKAPLEKSKGATNKPRVSPLQIDDEISEESPLSKSLVDSLTKRSPEKPRKGKRSRIISSSEESNDERPISSRERKRTKRISSDSSPTKPLPSMSRPKGKRKPVISSSEEEESVVVTDSEDEFVEKVVKRKKGDLPRGQKTLPFSKTTQKEPRKVASSKPPSQVNPADFFCDFGNPRKATSKEKKSPTREQTEKDDNRGRQKEDEKLKKVLSERIHSDSPPRKSTRLSSVEQKSAEKNVVPEEKKRKVETPKKKKETTKEEKKKDEEKGMKHPPKRVQENIAAPILPKKEFVPWVDKYRPQSLQQLVGQHGEKSPMNKLLAWLKRWPTWHLGEGAKIKRPKPPPFVETDGSPFKAILLSGSPGIGKTTCAQLACSLLGLNFVEMNASDVRNKKSLESHVTHLISSHQMDEFLGAAASKSHSNTEVQHVLIMDEVDGMSGNEDRAGLSELISLIKTTRIPIICICNDRSSPKMRSLVNHAYDVRFPKPRAEQFTARLMSIAAQEKLSLKKEELVELVEQSGHDVRQAIYHLQMKAAGGAKHENKDYAINTFDAARRLLGSSASLSERTQMFFVDYSIMPLFVQENYPKMVASDKAKSSKRNELACLRKASDLLAWGDVVEKSIRGGGAWKLLNEQSMLSAALPGMAMEGSLRSQIQFPSWLGRNSTSNKRLRLMRQLEHHAHLKLSASASALVMDYVPVLRDRLVRPLAEREGEGVPEVLKTMVEYDLLKDDAEAIAELALWPGHKDIGEKVAPKTKAALTRALNKEHRLLPYVVDDVAKGRRVAAEAEVEVDEDGNLVERRAEEDALEEQEDEEDKKPQGTTTSKSSGAGSRGGSGARGRGRGRGRGK